MKKTLKEMLSAVDLITRQRWTEVQRKLFINNAYDEICSMGDLPFLRKEADITATTDQTEFDYPEDFRKAERLYLNDSTNENDGQVFNQENDFYNITKNSDNGRMRFKFRVAPGTNLKLIYFYNPSKLVNDSDIPVIPEYFHRLIEVKAAIQALRIDNRDKNQIQLLEAERLRLERLMLNYESSKPTRRKRISPVNNNGDAIEEFEPLGDGF